MFQDKKILFIGAHPDDIELGAGAMISHLRWQAAPVALSPHRARRNQRFPAQGRMHAGLG